MKVFMSVLCNSRSIRYSYYFYQYSPEAIKAALLVIYGLKCYLSLYRQREGEQELLYFASYPNEHRVLSHVRDNLRMIPHGEIRISLRNCISLVALREVGAFLPTVPRLYRFARRLTRKHPFMPACRIFSTVTYFMRFRRLLDADVKAVFIACQYSPECLGLATAAHQSRVKVLFTNHASATGETGYVAPLHADLVAVSSQAVADLYQRHTPHKLNIVPFTIAEPQQPMRALNNESAAHRVGIYLTALTDEARLQEVIADLLQFPAIGSVFVRTHPAAVVNADLSHIRVGATDAQEAVETSHAIPLGEDIARTDIAVCGNSTVAIEILRGGKPVLYDHRLDRIVYDYNGYVGQGMVLPYPDKMDADAIEQIRRHYCSSHWRDKMRYFDAGYQGDEPAILKRFVAAVAVVMQQA